MSNFPLPNVIATNAVPPVQQCIITCRVDYASGLSQASAEASNLPFFTNGSLAMSSDLLITPTQQTLAFTPDTNGAGYVYLRNIASGVNQQYTPSNNFYGAQASAYVGSTINILASDSNFADAILIMAIKPMDVCLFKPAPSPIIYYAQSADTGSPILQLVSIPL